MLVRDCTSAKNIVLTAKDLGRKFRSLWTFRPGHATSFSKICIDILYARPWRKVPRLSNPVIIGGCSALAHELLKSTHGHFDDAS